MIFTVKDLWNVLGDVPIDDDECIEIRFLHFEIGTNKYEIWHWFENAFGTPVYQLMYSETEYEEYKEKINENRK